MKPVEDKQISQKSQHTTNKSNMMWEFVTHALLTRRYGLNLHTVKQLEDKWIFAVRAVNQKAFQPHESNIKEQSWALFLDYGQLKGRKKPVSCGDYTKLRSNFFNAIVRCACHGVISKVDRNMAADLNITIYKDYKYFMYRGKNMPEKSSLKTEVSSNIPAVENNQIEVTDPTNSFEGPLPPGQYLFRVKIVENGEVGASKLLGAMPDNLDFISSVGVKYRFVNSNHPTFVKEDSPVMSYDLESRSESSLSVDSQIIQNESLSETNMDKDVNGLPQVVKLEPDDSDNSNSIIYDEENESSCDSDYLQIDYVNVTE